MEQFIDYPERQREPFSISPEEILRDYELELAGLVAIANMTDTEQALLHFLDDISMGGRIMETYTARCGWDWMRLVGLQGKNIVARLDAIATTINEAYRERVITAQFIKHMYAQVQSLLSPGYS